MEKQLTPTKLVKLANELGFVPENLTIGWKEDYYLWMCLLQKWLREIHKINILIDHIDSTIQYHYNYNISNANNREHCDEDLIDQAKMDLWYWKRI